MYALELDTWQLWLFKSVQMYGWINFEFFDNQTNNNNNK